MTFISSAGQLMRYAASLAVGSCLALGALSAQQSTAEWTAVRPGQRVRITTPGALAPTRQVGRVLSVQADSIRLEPDGNGEPVAFPRIAITDMEVSQGQHRSTATGIVIGVLGGGAAGVISVAATTSKPKPCPTDLIEGLGCTVGEVGEGIGPSTGQGELIVGVLGAIVGGVVGGFIGHAHQSEYWEPALLGEKVSVTPMITPGRIHAAGVRFAFEWR